MRQAIESAHLQNCMEIYAGLVRHAESQAIHKTLSQQACEPAKLPANQPTITIPSPVKSTSGPNPPFDSSVYR